jgi:hypothetical protein
MKHEIYEDLSWPHSHKLYRISNQKPMRSFADMAMKRPLMQELPFRIICSSTLSAPLRIRIHIRSCADCGE